MKIRNKNTGTIVISNNVYVADGVYHLTGDMCNSFDATPESIPLALDEEEGWDKVEEKLNPFVFIRGVEGKGSEVIAELKKRGGYVLYYDCDGEDRHSLYYINSFGCIDDCYEGECKWLENNYEEIKLEN